MKVSLSRLPQHANRRRVDLDLQAANQRVNLMLNLSQCFRRPMFGTDLYNLPKLTEGI